MSLHRDNVFFLDTVECSNPLVCCSTQFHAQCMKLGNSDLEAFPCDVGALLRTLSTVVLKIIHTLVDS